MASSDGDPPLAIRGDLRCLFGDALSAVDCVEPLDFCSSDDSSPPRERFVPFDVALPSRTYVHSMPFSLHLSHPLVRLLHPPFLAAAQPSHENFCTCEC